MVHGQLNTLGIHAPLSRFHDRGVFGRLFQGLAPFAADLPQIREKLLELGARGGLMDANDPPPPTPNPRNLDNDTISAGFTFFGQFIDHDLTFDPTSSLERQNDPEAIENFRTPALELDNVYGGGPRISRHLYDLGDPAKFLIETLDGPDSQSDLPRNSQRVALIADPRNDENVIVSQLHVAMLKFHNAVVDRLRGQGVSSSQLFEEAQRMVRWHYQWIIVNEFLPRIVGQDVVRQVINTPAAHRLYRFRNEPFIPVEFAVAAYRFGHSQVRQGYRMNFTGPGFAAPIFNNSLPPGDEDPTDLRGGKRARRRFVEWENFFLVGDPARRQLSKLIDTRLSSALFGLPVGAPGQPGPTPSPTNPDSLAQRNLLRGLALGLPSGQAMAARVGVPALTPEQLEALRPLGVGFERSTPPWYYM
ncbi:MAG TPA: heme peroxidase family protein, partial [Myxococcaceae bacterium]|nr:heme peroxidase family protein [Myxococcaceae bacterium]